MERQFLCLILGAFVALTSPGIANGQGFSTAPLLAPSAMPSDSMPGTPRAFFEWLRGQDSSTLAVHGQQIREHLYALIAVALKQRFAASRAAEVPTGDTTLAQLFEWADGFGVPGAAVVAQAIGARKGSSVTPHPADGFQLTFSAPMFSLATEHGKWMVRFPYFFMIGTVTRQRLANGIESDVASLSTLTAPNHAAIGGASQATILILSAQTSDLPSYVAFWLQRMQIAPTDTVANPVPQATRSYQHFDARSRLWKELVALKIPSGSLVVTYIGLDGTYQANRPHFLDLLTSLRVRQ
jgi:hypothetical protein